MHWYDIIAWPLWISWFSWFVILILYLPLVIYFLRKLLRKAELKGKERIVTVFLTLLITLAIPLGDVYWLSMQMNRYCKEEAGLHVYRYIEGVDSFASSTREISRSFVYQGFYRFTEHDDYTGKQNPDLIPPKYYRVTLVDAKPHEEEIPNLTSNYYHYTKREVLSPHFAKWSEVIEVRDTHERLGDLVNFYFYYGWLDRLLIGWYGYGGIGCVPSDQEPMSWNLIPMVLKPVNKTNKQK